MIPKKIYPNLKAFTHYRSALLQTLFHLRPKYCLEIGTNHGASARVFQRYFDECCPDGDLITCDIKKYVNLNDCPNVHQIKVHPWDDNVEKFHAVKKDEFLKDDPRTNTEIIQEKIKGLGISCLGFVFIDGDHTENGIKSDLKMCADLPIEWPRYMLIDDTDSVDQDVGWVYRDVIKKNSYWNTYDYDDWGVRVAASLVWRRDTGETIA